MIPFNFKYYRPENIDEASNIFNELLEEGMDVIIYSGGTEIVTNSRKHLIHPDAVIDIKAIPEVMAQEDNGKELIFGAGLSITDICKMDLFPLLSEMSSKIADKTVRNQLTLGGNICGRLPYREAIVPFLMGNTIAVIATTEGLKEVALKDVFKFRLPLAKGEFLVQLKIDKDILERSYKTIRKEKVTDVDYPIIHMALTENKGSLSLGVAGLLAFPFCNDGVNEILNKDLSVDEKTNEVIENLPSAIKNDILASKEYRGHLFKTSLNELLNGMGGQ